MNDFEITLPLNNPLTKEDWDKITDAELERTPSVTFTTPSGKEVEFVKVKHGRWIDKGLELVCSACGIQYSDELPFMSKLSTPGGGNMEGFEYCPHCGAKMDRERKDT